MKKSTLLTLAAFAAVIVIAAFFATTQRGSIQTDTATKGLFYPDLGEKIDAIDRVVLTAPERKLEFAKKNEAWVATYKHDYPANAGLILKTLHALATMKKTEEKTKKPEGFEKLGVEDKLTASSRGFFLQGFSGTNNVVSTHIGARAPTGKDEFFVRDNGDEQVWQVRGDLTLKDDDETWLSAEIIDLDKDRIMAVDFSDEGGHKFSIMRAPKDTSYELSPRPEGRKIKSPYIIDMASRGLTKLDLSDVRPLTDFDMPVTPFATYKTFDGLVVQLFYAEKTKANGKIIGLDKKGWIKLVTSLDEKQLADGGGNKEKMSEEIQQLNERLQNWAYHIPSYKIEQMKRSLESMLEPQETKPVKKGS